MDIDDAAMVVPRCKPLVRDLKEVIVVGEDRGPLRMCERELFFVRKA